jgi:hypothetical protein
MTLVVLISIYIVSICTRLQVKHVLSLHALLDDLSRAHFHIYRQYLY